jgi:hypothetical protein
VDDRYGHGPIIQALAGTRSHFVRDHGGLAVFGLRVHATVPCLHGTILAYRFPNSEGNVMTLTSWGVLLGLLLVAAIVVAAIALIIRFVIRHRRGYD